MCVHVYKSMQVQENEYWRDPSDKSNLYDSFIDGRKTFVTAWQIDWSN